MTNQSFKSFLSESNRKLASFVRYEHDFHDSVTKTIRGDLKKVWAEIDSAHPKKDPKGIDEKKQELYRIEMDGAPSKVGKASGKTLQFPSIRIGNKYDPEQAIEARHDSFVGAYKVISKAINKVNKNLEIDVLTTFQEGSHGTIRVMFISGGISKPIFTVEIDHNQKFDRIYFKDHLR